ncbi:SAM-dependent methyltransferase [Actinomadura parmotrematis]|uniref:SAM-dependent methyltransferase n=1 Tax=Actinomadura parmotrematis TaxID=2864039 RepID=A0ABS7FR40_9ACTN|nr:SAM-dependent methyltransferase [Actinomadura parmotrematis]MBW8482445.1 SAM-dependent methyltransferase [Actinomadura parmotrematis]
MAEHSSGPSGPTGPPTPAIDTGTPHSARVWNYWLGGKDNYPIDRQVGDQVMAVFPAIVDVARHSRAFLGRAVRHLAGEAGIDQFLDIGTGLPTVDNTHEVAQRVRPSSKVVYVDNDPLVLVHAQALLTSSPEGRCSYLDADVHDPDLILEGAAETLDFDRPIALMMLGILGNVLDDDRAQAICDRLVAALPAGSYLVLEDGTDAYDKETSHQAQETRAEAGDPYRLRSPEQIAGFFRGLTLLEPGVVSVSRWRPEETAWGVPDEVAALCRVAVKETAAGSR